MAVLVAYPITRMILSILLTLGYIKVTELRMQTPWVYKPVANTLALYCQSDPKLFPKFISYAWLPKELSRIRAGYASIEAEHAWVEMGGGFHHFGYKLNLDDRETSPTTNAWVLSFTTEGAHGPEYKYLTTVRLPKTRRLSKEELIRRVVAGYDRRLSSHPEDGSAHKGKVLLYLRCGDLSGAELMCEQWAKARPDSWVPRFTLAHIRSRMGNGTESGAQFARWVEQQQSFTHYIMLFLFYMREGKDMDALEAIRKSLQQPFEESAGSANKFYMGHNAGVFAFSRHRYDLCLAMCDKMLVDKRRGEDSWRNQILQVKAAAYMMEDKQREADGTITQIADTASSSLSLSEKDKLTRSRFVEAVQKNDRAFIGNYRNWQRQFASWFSPFSSDETCTFPRPDLSNPYPENWDEEAGVLRVSPSPKGFVPASPVGSPPGAFGAHETRAAPLRALGGRLKPESCPGAEATGL